VTIKLEGDENPAVGSVTGTEEINLGSDYTLTAGSQGGYVFERWSGDSASDQNPISGTLQSPLTLIAHYVKDMRDSDGDGLNNYREFVELGTNADSNDTDADGLADKEEVDIGSSPLDSDKVIVDYLRGQATVTLQATEALHQAEMEAERISSYASGRVFGFEEGNQSGVLFVANNPGRYDLFTETELNSSVEQATHEGRARGFEEGNQSGVLFVANNPGRYDLFTETELDTSVEQATVDGRNAGISEGEQRVVSDPKTYSLVSKSDYDSMVQELIELSDNNSTPYTSGWFYISSRDWIYTNKEIFPYFFDSSTGGWMFFRSGVERPTFYHYGKKEWITLED
jgi:flagellar biosynthesis/type III secretory pathway protein FliH